MHHTYACALRWADMDMLGHVNNVRYVDYLAGAREAFLAGLDAARAPIVRHRVDFAAPLVFRREPVLVDSWVTGMSESHVALAHEVYDDRERAGEHEDRRVYLRASTVLAHQLDDEEREHLATSSGRDHAWRPLTHERRPPRSEYLVHVRPSDLGPQGVVNDAVLFEYLQEARIHYLMGLHTRGQSWTRHVVARTDVEYHGLIRDRSTPYVVRSWIGHLGTSSFTICAELCDPAVGDAGEAEEVLAEATVVMVTFDAEAQRPAPMSPTQRGRLAAELSAG